MGIPLNNSNLKKILSIILIVNIVIIFTKVDIFSQSKTLTMSQAVNYAQDVSKDYRNKQNSKVTKKIQLMQAIDAVKDIRKKESTVRFSLLFNIQMPEKHALPKEIDLLMNIPKIETEIKGITKELENIKLSTKEETETCFIDVYGCEQKCKFNQSILNEMNKRLAKMRFQQKSGIASQKDISSLENKIKTQETKVSGLLQTFERQKEKLSEIVNFDVSTNYLFTNPMQKVDIDRNYLNKIIDYSLNNDLTLYKAQNEENIARKNVDELYNVYNKKWGGIVKRIESEVHKDTPIDFDQFLDKYNDLLVDIDKPWSGDYTIKLLFIKINIPKAWFKKELDGLRYFEDQKYAIFVALKEKEDAINKTQFIKKELKTKVEDDFENLKALWKAYNASLDVYMRAKKEYDRVYMANKVGTASYDDVNIEKNNLELAQEAELDNLIAYNKQLCSYDKLTCGAITALRKDENVFLKSVKTGNSTSELEELIGLGSNVANKIIYYINNAVDQRRVVFGLQVPSEYPDKITHYEVLTPEKTVIAKKTDINKSISVLPIEYKGSTELLVRLYNNDQFITEGSFDAVLSRGVLSGIEKTDEDSGAPLKDLEKQEEKTVLGRYSITNFVGSSIQKLKLDIPSTEGVSFFKIVDIDGKQIGKKNKFYSLTESFSYLGFAMNDLSKLKIELYNAQNKLKYIAVFDEEKKEIVAVE